MTPTKPKRPTPKIFVVSDDTHKKLKDYATNVKATSYSTSPTRQSVNISNERSNNEQANRQ
jgi:hypothetical protein